MGYVQPHNPPPPLMTNQFLTFYILNHQMNCSMFSYFRKTDLDLAFFLLTIPRQNPICKLVFIDQLLIYLLKTHTIYMGDPHKVAAITPSFRKRAKPKSAVNRKRTINTHRHWESKTGIWRQSFSQSLSRLKQKVILVPLTDYRSL